jgi:phosphotransferase system IIA component
LQKIPVKYIKTLNLDYINTTKKNLIKKIVNKNENKNKNKVKTNNSNKNTRNSTKLTIESLS